MERMPKQTDHSGKNGTNSQVLLPIYDTGPRLRAGWAAWRPESEDGTMAKLARAREVFLFVLV